MTHPAIAIIGAGLSGASCASVLHAAGVRVTVFEKSRGSGGRLASRRSGEFSIDLGAQSLQAQGAEFRAQLEEWTHAGLLEAHADNWRPRVRSSQLTRALLGDVALVTATRIASIELKAGAVTLVDTEDRSYGPYTAVLIATPPSQAAELLGDRVELVAQCAAAELQPAWVAAFRSAEAWSGDRPLPPALAQITSLPAAGAQHWMVEAAATWSAAHIERDPQWVAAALKEQLRAPAIELLHCHRWRYARVARPLGGTHRWQPPLGLCGDWFAGDSSYGHGAEAAWCSGRALAHAVLAGNPN